MKRAHNKHELKSHNTQQEVCASHSYSLLSCPNLRCPHALPRDQGCAKAPTPSPPALRRHSLRSLCRSRSLAELRVSLRPKLGHFWSPWDSVGSQNARRGSPCSFDFLSKPKTQKGSLKNRGTCVWTASFEDMGPWWSPQGDAGLVTKSGKSTYESHKFSRASFLQIGSKLLSAN